MKLWTTKKADTVFSKMIRERDGKCMRCGKTSNLQCSHFWSRSHSSTRYSFENCITLCAGCHIFNWEREKQGAYRDFMLKWLGKKKFDALQKLAYSSVQRSKAIQEFMNIAL